MKTDLYSFPLFLEVGISVTFSIASIVESLLRLPGCLEWVILLGILECLRSTFVRDLFLIEPGGFGPYVPFWEVGNGGIKSS